MIHSAFIRKRLTNLLPQAILYLCLAVLPLYVSAQTPNPPKPQQPDEVIRINTELVQTDVMVFDKKGRFVDGLQREQFELSVDGKTQPISSFEQVRSGSSKETRLATNDK